MNNKINGHVEYYNRMLERKGSLVKPLHEKQNKFEELTDKEYTNMLILEHEIRLIDEFVKDLEHIITGEN